MADRMDIDALLISALYGELTPADEARLTAHLDSHPADRTALADLTQTRATFRDSRILAVQLEPPHSVSALLLQEAARRAPRTARAPSEGWFQRFMRSFLAHPAMAAATMLVLVAGVAGTLYLSRGDQFAETSAPPAAMAPAPAAAAAAPAAAAPAAAGFADDKSTSAAPSPVANAAGTGSAPGSDAYRVRLDEAEKQARQGDVVAKQQIAQDDLAGPAGRPAAMADSERKESPVRELEPSVQAPAKPSAMVTKLAKKPSGIELRRPELMPKDLDDNQDSVKRDFGRARGADNGASVSVNEHARASGSGAPAGGGGATAASGMIAVQPRPVAPAAPAPAASSPDPSEIVAGGPSAGSKGKAAAPSAKPIPRSTLAQAQEPSQAQAPSPPPPPATVAPAAGRDNSGGFADRAAPSADAKAEDKPTEDKALLGWAQKQRDQVIAFVRSNNCRAAANTATAIYTRAPGYYAANIATDRSVKPCLAYLNSEREREDRSKASERQERSKAAAKRVDAAAAPAAAPEPPPARK